MNNIDKMINVFKNKSVEEAINGFNVEQNDEITDQEYLESKLNYKLESLIK